MMQKQPVASAGQLQLEKFDKVIEFILFLDDFNDIVSEKNKLSDYENNPDEDFICSLNKEIVKSMSITSMNKGY